MCIRDRADPALTPLTFSATVTRFAAELRRASRSAAMEYIPSEKAAAVLFA